jgi:hypothetical protein
MRKPGKRWRLILSSEKRRRAFCNIVPVWFSAVKRKKTGERKNMILFQDNLVVLDYDPATDILYVQWPDIRLLSLVELEYSYRLICENIEAYDIKKLLVQGTRTNSDIYDPDYKGLLYELVKALFSTRLQKVARIVSADANREEVLSRYFEVWIEELQPALEFRRFDQKEEAYKWLLNG